jgi:uncharacterized membrane protein
MSHDRHWGWHPQVRTGDQLTLGERAADKMRNGMGSWRFVFAFFAVMITWAAYNRNTGFDPYPFILLNLFLSMLAGIQAAALLIAAKRSDTISSEIALHTERVADDIKKLLEQNIELTMAVEELTRKLHAHIVGESK